MARYRLIGKSKHMKSLFLKDADGKMHQHQIVLGKEMLVNEEELTPLVYRLVAKKAIKLIELEEEDPGMAWAVVEDGEAPEWEEEPVEEKLDLEEEPEVVEELEVTHESPEVDVEEMDESTPKPRRGRGIKKD